MRGLGQRRRVRCAAERLEGHLPQQGRASWSSLVHPPILPPRAPDPSGDTARLRWAPVPSRPMLAVVASALGLALVASWPGPGQVVDVVTVRPDATSTDASTPTATSYAGADPATWPIRRLAAQLVFSCVDLGDLDAARGQAAAGIAGISLLGSPPPRHLGARLAAVRRSARTAVLPFVASDEEGGTVQRLRDVIYRLPSARTMGGWRPARVRRTA